MYKCVIVNKLYCANYPLVLGISLQDSMSQRNGTGLHIIIIIRSAKKKIVSQYLINQHFYQPLSSFEQN